LKAFKELAKVMLSYDDAQLQGAVTTEILREVNYDE
jgi:hypothetical protein